MNFSALISWQEAKRISRSRVKINFKCYIIETYYRLSSIKVTKMINFIKILIFPCLIGYTVYSNQIEKNDKAFITTLLFSISRK